MIGIGAVTFPDAAKVIEKRQGDKRRF